DDWSVLIQRVAQALFFFHPSVLWISRRLDGERELACDDTVVHQTGVTVGYAACLTHVAQLTIEPPRTALAAGAFLTRKRLFTRVERIIENRLYLSAASSRVAVAGALLLLLAALAQFALTPSVVAIDRPSVRAETSEGGLIGRSGDEREDPRLISKILPAVYVGPQATGSEILYAPSVDAGVVTVLPESPVAVAAVSSEGSASLEKTYDKLIKEFNVQRRRLERKMRNRNPNDNAFAGLSRKMRAAEKRYREIYESALAQRSSTRIESARKQIERELRRLRQGAGYLGGVSIGPGGAKGYVLSAPTADAPHVYVAPGSLKSVAPRVRARLDAIAVPGVAAPVIAFDDDGGGIYGYSAPDGATTILYEPVRASTRSGTETTITSDGGFVIRSVDDEISYKWTDRGHRLDMRARGRIEFAEDDSDVSGLSDDGYLIIRERHRGDDREYEVSADGSGGLERVYYEDGRRAEIDDNAREWIGEMLARAIRNTGIGAEKRVGRILKSGGVDAVLDEIGLIESDHAMSIYYRALMGKSEMDVKQRIRLLDHLSKELDSDYQRAEVLSEIDETWLENKEIRLAYVASVGRIDSDYEKRRALSPVISRTDLSPELRLSLLNIAREIDSDYERAELLGEIARSGLDESEVLDAYVIAIEDIDSDYEKRRVLAFITDRRDLSKETALAVLKMAQSISSDYERAELLLEMYRYSRDNDTLMQAYVDAIVDIDSDYEKRRVLDELTSNRKLNDDLALTVLGIAGSIDSDYERAELLTHMARFCTGNPKLIEVYLDALADLESDYETRRVLEQLDLGEKTDPGLLIRVLSVVQRIESNYDKAQILEGLAPICLDSNELYEAFLDAVDSITSDYERNQLLSIIYDRDRRLRKGSK
ncbi:MAG: M56 family metallopeptidase, partial [Candidatus Zixiibacteriota bacterium]